MIHAVQITKLGAAFCGSGANLQSFPLRLLPLCQLQVLYMDLGRAFAIPAEIARVADWSCLKELHLDDDVKDDFDSRLHLLASSHKLKFRGVYTTI